MSAHAGSFNITTAAATSTVAVTGVGFQPTCILFWWSGRTESTDASGSADAQIGFGVCGGTTIRGARTARYEDGVTTTVCSMYQSVLGAILEVDGTGALAGSADLSSFDSDGFTMVIDTQFTTNLRVSYLALDMITDVDIQFVTHSATGSQAVSGLGFAPDALMALGCWGTGETGATAGFMHVGAATGPSNEWSQYVWNRNGQSTTVADSYGYGGEITARSQTTGPPTTRAEVTSLDSDGYTLNVLEAGATAATLYIALAGGQIAVGDTVTYTDTSNHGVTGVGFQPEGVLLVSVCEAEHAQDTETDDSKMSIGAFVGSSVRTAQAISSQNGLSTSEVFTAIEHDEAYIRPDLADGVEGLMDAVSLDSDGFTVVMDDADPGAAFVGYIAFAATASGNAIGSVNAQIMG